MKSPLGRLKKALHKGEAKENWDQHVSAHFDSLAQAAKDMRDMRACCDSLLSAAAATANSAYEFSESLLEMGNCLLEKTAIRDDGESGSALSMLGRVQLELQKLVDSYRSHIIMTITNPSESLLSELRKVEEMKLQCDEKRETFEFMVGQHKEKGKSKHGKGESFTSEQLHAVREEYDEAARLCVFRVESLKQGQCRSLLTQAARHHAAQLNFFRRGLQSLEAVEPHVKIVAERQHIDYELSELDEGDDANVEENSYKGNDGELSFDYRRNKQDVDISHASRRSTEISFGKNQGEQISSQKARASSFSAPIYPEKFDPAERIKDMQTALQKLNTHVLPTPADAKNSRLSSSTLLPSTTSPRGSTKNLWHSSPLDMEKHRKVSDNNISSRNLSKSRPSIEENNNRHFLPLPRPVGEVTASDAHSGFDTRNIKRQAFSGPLASKAPPNKPLMSTSGPIGSIEIPQSVSGLLSHMPVPQPSSSVNVSQSASPPLVSSPRISELHELPRPPDSLGSKPMAPGSIGHSAPLGNRKREVSPTSRSVLLSSKAGSQLPLPQLTVSRSFSIPSNNQRALNLQGGKTLESSQVEIKPEQVASPPLTPISLSNMKSSNPAQIRVDAGRS